MLWFLRHREGWRLGRARTVGVPKTRDNSHLVRTGAAGEHVGMSSRHRQALPARKGSTVLPISLRGWIWLGATATSLAIWYAIVGCAFFG
jgi:hypothetical protein